MHFLALAIPLLIAASSAAPTQFAIPVSSTVLAPLPAPTLAEGVKPSDALRAAQGALATGNVGEVEQALEMAETRMLDRSVARGETNNPSDNLTVGQISEARRALTERDRVGCMEAIQTAIRSATAQGL
ncbi:MAG: hypothetical protein M3Y22_04320 [Pseudomonadota bacterium]|nr:hypothetical protein [Pseudomonadota bacterium]